MKNKIDKSPKLAYIHIKLACCTFSNLFYYMYIVHGTEAKKMVIITFSLYIHVASWYQISNDFDNVFNHKKINNHAKLLFILTFLDTTLPRSVTQKFPWDVM